MELYDETCFECSKLITEKYSTSFSKGIKAFHKRFRYPIYGIYGFVRYADEIVDTFHDQDQQQILATFRGEAYQAINNGISLNPVLHAFQFTVNQHHIPVELIEAFLDSMQMDLVNKKYSEQEYLNYIHGSAEVIGLMCLKVFCEGDEALYNDLSQAACSLGSALQKINFLRDIRSDFYDRGRVYFPGIDFEHFTDEIKRAIEADIQCDLDKAKLGIKGLPAGARSGVYVAYAYYLQLFKQICKTPAKQIRQKRVRVPDTQKTLLYCKAVLNHGLGLL